ncbi:hypothetical protein QUB63_33170 [Microcoleus sp. ARI1-B5]|uniref:hypothetical protein n=1 Tax=unclassified Microcoleus TaxID=2642155 RepID=UPI002FD4D4EB
MQKIRDILTSWVEHSDRPHREISRSNFERNNTDTKILLLPTNLLKMLGAIALQRAIAV